MIKTLMKMSIALIIFIVLDLILGDLFANMLEFVNNVGDSALLVVTIMEDIFNQLPSSFRFLILSIIGMEVAMKYLTNKMKGGSNNG